MTALSSIGASKPSFELNGAKIWKSFLDRDAQREMTEDIRSIAKRAPFLQPMTPWGKPMTVRMTSAGRFGWVTDRQGYRYEEAHPKTGQPWPEIPPSILTVWKAVAETPTPPDCCLVNYYSEKARMGLHQDKDEADFGFPVVSISLGDPATFRIGGSNRKDPTQSVTLESGDVLLMGGEARLAFHGIDRIKFGGSTLLPDGGRINLTLRRVAPAEAGV
ncbi:MAG: alpha-ketoglutarate-dependent dioxygenase AlkB [Pseudomonadota bacterium]